MRVTWRKPCSSDLLVTGTICSHSHLLGNFNYNLLCQIRVTWCKPCSSDLLVPGGLPAVTAICWTISKLQPSLPGASDVAETPLLWSSGTWRTICSHYHFFNYTLLWQVCVTWRKPCSSDLLIPGGLSAVTAICWAIYKLHSFLPGANHMQLLWSPGTWRTICSHSHLLGSYLTIHSSLPGSNHVVKTLLLWSSGLY